METMADVKRTTPQQHRFLEPFLATALDLCTNLAAEDRYLRLLEALHRVVPYEAAALLSLEQGWLVPMATVGLRAEATQNGFNPDEHPRLARILASPGPVRFEDSSLPDPFDGLLSADPNATTEVHACMGCALRVENETVGALTVDAQDAHAFDDIDEEQLATFAALAAAAMRTARLIDALEQAAKQQGLVARQLVQEAHERAGGQILGLSEAMVRVRSEVKLLARSDLTVLITGETGVGKEVVARALQTQSLRSHEAMIHVNCAALPESIAESELFGHVRGAFTGATQTRPGRFEAAHRGTIFLDEIGELSLSMQPKLLRVLQSGEVQRLGTDRPSRVDVRVIAATNRELAEEVRAGRFRADLYHRLSVYPLHVPPLRERQEDIEPLAGYFLDRARIRLGLGPVRLSPTARAALLEYPWPGNVRELEHVLARAALRAAAGRRREAVRIESVHLGLEAGVQASSPGLKAGQAMSATTAIPAGTLTEQVDEFKRHRIAEVYEQTGRNWAATAKRLGLDRGNLHRLARRLGLSD